ncbi:hypothetical protein LguiB_000935 [Lonicera macranthoides]
MSIFRWKYGVFMLHYIFHEPFEASSLSNAEMVTRRPLENVIHKLKCEPGMSL